MEHSRAGSSACTSCRYRRDRDRFCRSFHAHEGAYRCDIIVRGCGKARGILGGFSFARRTKEVKKLFTSVNGTSPVQIRSRCAILLCSVYGLRAGEVCCLRLEDIDWAEERISVRRPKQRK